MYSDHQAHPGVQLLLSEHLLDSARLQRRIESLVLARLQRSHLVAKWALLHLNALQGLAFHALG